MEQLLFAIKTFKNKGHHITMNKYYLIFLLPFLLLFSCSEEGPEFEYDFRIARTIYRNNSWSDSSVFYYDKSMRLLREDRCYGVNACARHTIYYNDNSISNSSVVYQLDEEQRIVSRENGEDRTTFFYDDERISHAQRDFHDEHEKRYFFYEQDQLVSDSTVVLLPGQSSERVTVYQHEYSDLVRPEYMIHGSGLFEFPQQSVNLLSSSTAHALGLRTEFEYEFTENSLIQHARSIDLFNDQEFFNTTRIYYLLDDM